MTKQLIFSAWNAAPSKITTLLSYDAERQMLRGSELHGENTAEARKRFRGGLRYRLRDGEPMAMSTLAPLAISGDPLTAARKAGTQVSETTVLN
ncbi:hypothetical protein GCM10009784_27080 [Arthrobacter parietis]|uniref:Uncharacterized protein n=1 Tax=Arthrobacter parietis TaxID=271434 RepID=A0ABN3B0L2_9MICC